MKKRKRRQVKRTDLFEYGGLVLQFSPDIPIQTSYSLWAGYLREHHPETGHRFYIQQCCRAPQCKKFVIMFKVDPQPKGSGFCLQISESKEQPKETKIGENIIAGLIFESSFPKEYSHQFNASNEKLRRTKILSTSECIDICQRLTRHCYYTRILFEHEEWKTMFIRMTGDSHYIEWVKELEKERAKLTDAEAQENTANMLKTIRKIKDRYTP